MTAESEAEIGRDGQLRGGADNLMRDGRFLALGLTDSVTPPFERTCDEVHPCWSSDLCASEMLGIDG